MQLVLFFEIEDKLCNKAMSSKSSFNHLYFELFEKLGLLNKSEMMNPHSVLITSKVEFDILLPPRKIITE